MVLTLDFSLVKYYSIAYTDCVSIIFVLVLSYAVFGGGPWTVVIVIKYAAY
jgi:hypothetical protein